MSSAEQTDGIVTAGWIREHLDDPAVAFVHIGSDRAEYDAGHLPPAVWADGYDDFGAERDGIRALVPAKQELEATLGHLGIDESKTVVFLASGKSMWPSRGYWCLRYYRFPRVRVADVSLAALQREGVAVTTAQPRVTPARCTLGDPDPSVLATADDVLAVATRSGPADDATPRILDCRSNDEFAGLSTGSHPAPRAGRVPRAHHLNWELLVDDDGRFLPPDRLRSLYAAAGIDGTRPVFPYCGGGIRSAASWFAMHEILGWTLARNYDGSWAEWSRRTDLPVEASEAQ